MVPCDQVLVGLRQFHAELRTRFGARLLHLRLFGSYARGDSHEESDVDVLVVVEGLTRPEWNEVCDLSVPHHLHDQIPLAPLTLSAAQWDERVSREKLSALDIEREGVVL